MSKVCKRIRIYGIVQGVGFRPFVKREADRCNITGTVQNKGSYVEIMASGSSEDVRKFYDALITDPPERAVILRTESRDSEKEAPEEGFFITESVHRRGEKYIPPDIAVCDKCAEELFDPGNRRYLHPFINCTQCGPRFTILKNLPYDRERTSMAEFPMCSECAAEYSDRESRRFDAQPVCCNNCGPEVYIINSTLKGMAAITEARKCIAEGGIIAVKGIGGFHLCCDARNESAVELLRKRKKRPVKPFAVMMKDMQAVLSECVCGKEEEKILRGYQKPIVLLERSATGSLPEVTAPGNPRLGIMLPYTPVHLMLFNMEDGVRSTDALIMTSGNISGDPICMNDDEAVRELSGIADIFLSNDREILTRADDTVMDIYDGRPYMIRRSRGYVPLPIVISGGNEDTVLAVGGELKNSFCTGIGGNLYLSAYIGDLTYKRSVDALKMAVNRMEDLLEAVPDKVICDMHPGYNSTAAASEIGKDPVKVQHHYAHILSVMAENDYLKPVIGAAFDGTGYGTDGTIWGGEILKADTKGFVRLSSIRPFKQPGGDAGAREGWRIAVSMLHEYYSGKDEKRIEEELGFCSLAEADAVDKMIDTNTNIVMSTSAGRLFDGVSAILGICGRSTFEGEAAMALQAAAESCAGESVDISCIEKEVTETVSDYGRSPLSCTDRLFRYIVKRRLEGEDSGRLALIFHKAFALMTAVEIRKRCRASKIKTAALSGGCFQNILLLDEVKKKLEEYGIDVLIHSLVPPNDGGIALGQCLYGLMNI